MDEIKEILNENEQDNTNSNIVDNSEQCTSDSNTTNNCSSNVVDTPIQGEDNPINQNEEVQKPDKKNIKENVQKVISFLKQKSSTFELKPNNKQIIMKYDRHGEDYELIEDEVQPLGKSETIRDVILRGLQPEIKNNNSYGTMDTRLTKTQRVVKAQQAILDGSKLLKDKGQEIINAYNKYMEEQSKLLDKEIKKEEENKEVK